MSKNNYYKVLGLESNASTDDIKKAYRKLSLKHHPDRTQNDPTSCEIFQMINEAYETLGDEDKRKQYDLFNNNPFINAMGGVGGMPMPMPFPFENIDSLFSDIFFGGNNPFGNVRNMSDAPFNGNPFNPPGGFHIFRNGVQVNEKPSAIVKNIEITLEQSFTGCKIPLEVERWVIENNNKVFEKITYYIDIFPGIDDNEVILLQDKGNIINEKRIGDVKIFIKVINNTEFIRNGIDLILNKTITLKESLCGFSFDFVYLNGKKYCINNHSGNIISPEYKKYINNMGLIRDKQQGNLIIIFHIDFPEKLDEEIINKLNELL